jgi:hypothetical protein
VDWIGPAKDRNRWRALVNSVLNLWVPWNAGKLSSGLSSSAQLHRVSLVPKYKPFKTFLSWRERVMTGIRINWA